MRLRAREGSAPSLQTALVGAYPRQPIIHTAAFPLVLLSQCEYVQVDSIYVLAVAFPYGLALVRVGRGRRLPDWAGHIVPPAHTHTHHTHTQYPHG